MYDRFRPCILTLAASSACALWGPLAAQSPASRGAEPDSPDVCAIVTHDEVKKLSEDPLANFWAEPEATMVAGGAVCDYSGGQIRLYRGSNSEASWAHVLKVWNQDGQPRTSVSGIGDRAYLMYNKPRDKYEGRYVIVAVTAGQQTVTVALEANGEEPVEQVRPR